MLWLRRIFKKNKDAEMDEQLQQIRSHLETFQKFQWIKGEHYGKVTEFRDVVYERDKDMIWILFADGSRINFKKLDEYVLCAKTPAELLDIVGSPQNDPAQSQQSTATVKSKVNSMTSTSPVQALLKKQKQNPVDINMTITLNVPSVELYSVICESFENAETEIVDFVVSGLDTEALKNTLKDAIKNYYAPETQKTA